MQARLGQTVIYKHPPRVPAAPAMVTRVLSDGSINATVFTDNGRTFAVYGVKSIEALLREGVAVTFTGVVHWTEADDGRSE